MRPYKRDFDIEVRSGEKLPPNLGDWLLGGDWITWAIGAGVVFILFGGYSAGKAVVNMATKKDVALTLDAIMQGFGLSPMTRLMVIAQAGVETAMGTAGMAPKGFNYWNMSAGSSWTGPVTLGSDQEPDGQGGWKPITQKWRAYPTAEAGVQGFLDFLSMSRYSVARQYLLNGEPENFVRALFSAGYFTWPVENFTDSNGVKRSGYLSMFNGQMNLARQYLSA